MKLIEKVSQFLFALLICFLLFLNKNVGGQVLCTMMSILCEKNEMNKDEGWGSYDARNLDEKL